MVNLRVSVDRLREGMVIKSDVYAKSGTVLAREGTVVTKETIRLLTRHFVEEVMAVSEKNGSRLFGGTAGLPGLQASGERQGRQPELCVTEAMLSGNLKEIVCGRKDIGISSLLDTLNAVMGSLEERPGLSGIFSRMKRQSESLYSHTINVAMLAQLLARWLKCSGEEVEMAVTAALLHDIGVLEIVRENSTFSYHREIETNTYEQHVINGHNQLKEADIHPAVRQAVLTHHERLDGSGYPLKVTDANINMTSRIVAVADVYDTLTMEEPGEQRLMAFEALRKMELNGYRRFDAHILMIFMRHAAESLVQRSVRLNDGRIGHVAMINKYCVYQPIISLGGAFLDLGKQKMLYIEELL